MAYFDYHGLRSQADEALQAQNQPMKKLIKVHSGVTVGLGLVVMVLSYILRVGALGSSGLSGIGTRAFLEMAQMILEGVQLVILPFWSVGYIYGIVCAVRRQESGTSALRWGFRHWGVVLRSLLLQVAIYFGLIFLALELGMAVFMSTPASESIYLLTAQMEAAEVADMEAMMLTPEFWSAFMSLMPFLVGAMLLLLVPAFYRLRFTDYLLVEAPEQGAMRAVRGSIRLTKRKSFAVFRLDLHFWWFYLAQFLIGLLGVGELVLALAGIELGAHADLAYFGFYLAAMLCQFALFVWRKNAVFSVYALACAQMVDDMEVIAPGGYFNTPYHH